MMTRSSAGASSREALTPPGSLTELIALLISFINAAAAISAAFDLSIAARRPAGLR